MKKKLFVLFLVVLTVFSLSATVFGANITYTDKDGRIVKINDFLDTKGHWAHDTILKCADYGLVAGYQGNFMPNNYITRGDLAVIVDRMLGLKYVSYNIFDDLSNDAYYRDAVLKCVASGYIQGIGNGKVDPKGYATREQVAVIICRMFDIATPSYSYTSFADDAQISAWAKPSVAAVKSLGYMVGVGGNRFNPQAYITRAEMITLINNIAGTYITKNDTTNQGTAFRGTFPVNVMVCRYVTLTNSTVGRDLIITPYNTVGLNLTNSVVMGRIYAMGKTSITLSNSKVSELYLKDGKTTVTGINKDVKKVYIAEYASESTLDAIPEVLYLEPGVRVSIAGVMYENTTSRTKIYYGNDIKADIAAEQGYVMGGPRVRSSTFKQEYDNSISVSNVQVMAGDSKIEEVGVIWLSQSSNEDVVNPTYQNKDGKVVYDSNKIGGTIEFNVGTVYGTRAYRVYVKDSQGLYAYGPVSVFTNYNFNVSINVLDNDYPAKMDVEIIITGDSIPDITNVRLVYDVSEMYSENHNESTMRLYNDVDAEYKPDQSKYRRYIVTVNSKVTTENGVQVYTPPTDFGYIINFRDGTLINRFPVITEAVPSGVKPVTELTMGAISYSGEHTIVIDNSRLVTNHVAIQEVGVMYRETTASSVTSPENNSSGWKKVAKGYSIDPNDSFIFDANITTTNKSANTFMVLYVRTTGGYYYSDVVKVMNNWAGDDGGPRISGSIESVVLTDKKVVLKIPFTKTNEIDIFSNVFVVSATKNGSNDSTLVGKSLQQLDAYVVDNYYYLCLDNLSANSSYSLVLRFEDVEGLVSNLANVTFNTSRPVNISLNYYGYEYGWTYYTVATPNNTNYTVDLSNSFLVDTKNGGIAQGELGVKQGTSILMLKGVTDKSSTIVELACKYYIGTVNGTKIYYDFTRNLNIPN